MTSIASENTLRPRIHIKCESVCPLSKPIDLLMKEIWKKYNEDSMGWHVLVGRSSKGYYDVFVTNPKELWQIKLETIYRPNPIGLGARIWKNQRKRKTA